MTWRLPLAGLEPEFMRYEEREDGVYLPHAQGIADAQGLTFLCPKCYVELGGRVGCHSVTCWSAERGTPHSARPGPGRWRIEGSGFDDLTLNAEPPCGARSVVINHCGAHFFVTRGLVEAC